MRIVKTFTFLLLSIFCCSSYAHENKFVFVGQNGVGESTQTAFILEFFEDDFTNHVLINENGEIYIKVDKILAMPKEMLNRHTADIVCPDSGELSLAKASRDDWSIKWICSKCGYLNGPLDNRCQNSSCPSYKK